MAMKILIVDDEKPARDRLKRLLSDMEGYEIIAEAQHGVEAIEYFNKLQPDIVLLDIRMPVMDGIETAQHLMSHESPPAIIFTTAYQEHAIQAFETHAVDYLLKPIRIERLKESLTAATRTNRAQQLPKLQSMVEADNKDSPRTHICVRIRGNLELIPVDSIYYFFAEHKYITLKHKKGESLIEDSLIKLEKEFNKSFFRIHRNALVAMDKIGGLEKQSGDIHKITFTDIDNQLEVSRRHLAAVRRLLKGP